jgi:hypothetical protein
MSKRSTYPDRLKVATFEGDIDTIRACIAHLSKSGNATNVVISIWANHYISKDPRFALRLQHIVLLQKDQAEIDVSSALVEILERMHRSGIDYSSSKFTPNRALTNSAIQDLTGVFSREAQTSPKDYIKNKLGVIYKFIKKHTPKDDINTVCLFVITIIKKLSSSSSASPLTQTQIIEQLLITIGVKWNRYFDLIETLLFQFIVPSNPISSQPIVKYFTSLKTLYTFEPVVSGTIALHFLNTILSPCIERLTDALATYLRFFSIDLMSLPVLPRPQRERDTIHNPPSVLQQKPITPQSTIPSQPSHKKKSKPEEYAPQPSFERVISRPTPPPVYSQPPAQVYSPEDDDEPDENYMPNDDSCKYLFNCIPTYNDSSRLREEIKHRQQQMAFHRPVKVVLVGTDAVQKGGIDWKHCKSISVQKLKQ